MQLHKYQIEGIEYALKHRNTMIADEMGLGKTVQAIGYINANPEIKSVLIVCPLSLKLNWWNEVESWLDNKERCAINIVHYDALSKVLPNIGKIDLLIVDEAQYIKNAKTLRHQQVKLLTKRANHVLLLTGTPFENRVIELWPLLQILNPEKWDRAGFISKKDAAGNKVKVKVEAGKGAGFFTFAKRYCNAKQVTVWKKVNGRPRATTHWDFSGSSNEEELKDWLRKTGVIRRLKVDVLTELPPKQRQLIVLPAIPESEELRHYRDYFDDDGNNFSKVLSSLRENKVAFTEWSKKRAEQGFAKVEYVVEHVNRCIENGADKVILFAHHKEVILELAKHLVFQGCSYMTSEMTASERQDAVDIFNDDPNCKVIIGSFGTMGTGYTMTVSDLVVFAEIDPVPGRMYQAEDRAHRFGQERKVLVHYLVFDQTLEARICKILATKTDIINKVLG